MDKLTEAQINQMGSAVLAFVGDAVFLLFVRERLATSLDRKTGELTRRANGMVKATAQAKMLAVLSDKLTEREAEIVKRAKNTHTQKKAKNAGLADYRRATGFEALIGYLHLTGQAERLKEIQEACLLQAENEETEV